MTITLCIETSSAYCSLALGVQEQLFCRHEKLQRRHNERILPMLDDLFKEAGIAVRQTQVIGFGAGPGSFTGVRIAASIAQGIALASNALVVPMPGSEVLLRTALGEASSGSSTAQRWLTVVHSRAEAFYLALYDTNTKNEVIAQRQDRLYTEPPSWLQDLDFAKGSVRGIGPCPPWLSAHAPFEDFGDGGLNAAAMLETTRQRYREGEASPGHLALPIYVDGDSPWQKNSSTTARTT